ncbi:hypothetical protein ACKGJO_14640 [Gracilimonas sp. Q87]
MRSLAEDVRGITTISLPKTNPNWKQELPGMHYEGDLRNEQVKN